MNKPSTATNTLKYFWTHVRKYKFVFFLLLLGIAGGVILHQIMAPVILREIIDVINETPDGDRKSVWGYLKYLISMVAVAYVTGELFWRLSAYSNNYFQPSVMRDIEQDCLKNYHKHSNHFFGNHFIGSLVAKANRLIYGFERIAGITYWDFYPIFLQTVSMLTVLYFTNATVALIVFFWMIIFLTAASSYSIWKLKYDRQVADLDSKVNASLADSLTNYANVKSFAQQDFEQELFKKISLKRYSMKRYAWNLWEHFAIFQALFMVSLMTFLLYYSTSLWSDGKITVGSVVLIQILTMNLLWRVWEVGRYVRDLMESFANCEDMIQTIQSTPEVIDIAKPEKCAISKGGIDIQDLDFTYEESQKVFDGFSLSIKPGEKVGLVGESGSGKSTLSKLLMRLHDVDGGEISIDGQNIARITQDDLRRNIAFVPQDPVLFHRSLTDNIRYANPEASEEEALRASKKARAHGFIMKTADKYETLVGERGVKLSGGERQRIAIARAILKNAPILILDEATSALDSKVEKYIQEALLELMKKRTTIVIAHRLSTLRHMDRIVVLDKGKIMEEGTHDELLEKGGKYAELWNHQVGGFIG